MESPMTPRQIQLMKSSFAKVAAVKAEAAGLFYRRLFELDPSLRSLFTRDMAAQLAKLMAALGAVVGSLDLLENVLPLVRQLGRRHAAYGVRPDHYATLGEALIWTLAQALGPDFTRETRRAWTDAYGHVAWAMIAAAEEDDTLGQAA
jgi:hemoglobin-like flavoprotein